MNILQVNKFWWRHGGVEFYLAGVVGELRRRGHRVAEFGMRHDENVPSEYAEFFTPHVELRFAGRGMPPAEKLRTSLRLIYDSRVSRNVSALCERFQPDIAHVHLFERQLTPAVIHGLARSRVPIVQTFHDHSFVCPNYILMKGMTVPCGLECMRKGYQHAVIHRCVKKSRSASALSALELFVRKDVLQYHKKVELFVSPSAYLREILIEAGLHPGKVVHVPNYVRVDEFEPRYEPGDYALFVGRLSFEKGLWTLLKAAADLPGLEFRIVGRGLEGEALEREIARRELGNVRLEGFRHGEELRELYRNALCVVLPSECPENSPMVIYEAFASGKPVVGTALGGIPELIREGVDGLIVPAFDAKALAQALARLARSPAWAGELGTRGREKVVHGYDISHHVDRLAEIYERATRGAPHAADPARATEREPAHAR